MFESWRNQSHGCWLYTQYNRVGREEFTKEDQAKSAMRSILGEGPRVKAHMLGCIAAFIGLIIPQVFLFATAAVYQHHIRLAF